MHSRKFIFLFLFIFSFGIFLVFTAEASADTHISEAVTEDTTWTSADSPYIIDNSIAVLGPATLTIEPGVVVKFAPFSDIGMYNGGSLKALGSTESKIYFTSLADDEIGGDTNGDGNATTPDISPNSQNIWYGINISNDLDAPPTNFIFQNVVVRYADAGVLMCRVPDVAIENSLFERNRVGIYDCGDSHLDISNTEIKNNGIGIQLWQQDDLPGSVYEANGLSIHNNSNYGILNETHNPPLGRILPQPLLWLASLFKPDMALADEFDYTVDFRNTWWGDTTGPQNNDTNIHGLGNKVSNLVLFSPWITTDPNSTCCSSVLLLPGLEASRLYMPRMSGGEDQLWEPNGNSDVEALYLNTDGTSRNSNIYTKDIIKETNTPIPTGLLGQNIYKSFAASMDSLVANQKINDWKSYAYDWRQDITDIVNNGTKYQNGNVSLVSTLQDLAAHSKSGKVTIVAHSNGGLLAKALLKKLQADKTAGVNNLIDKVDVLILVAVPQIGTASAVPSILHGYKQRLGFGWLMDEVHARELGRNMLGALGLLPSKEYINHVSASPVTFVDTIVPSNVTTKMVQKFGSTIDSYAEYKDFLFGGEGRANPPINQTNLPISLSQSLFAKAESLHNNIDTWTPPSNIRVIEVAGWGLDTIASFEYYPVPCGNSTLNCVFTMDERPRFTYDGDGTVVVPSAHYTNFLGGAEKYWVDLPEHNAELGSFRRNREHKDILEIDQLNNLVKSVISKQDIIFDTILKNTTPVDTKNRLRLSIHSPVTLDAYDAEGNHTGKICPTNSDFCYAEENIANSSYMEFGEGKYLNLPEDKAKSIKLQGIDVGTFTYESEKVLPNGTSSTLSFVDIPVTTQTQAEIVSSPAGTPQLKLDVTGDGVTDFTLAPSSTFDPITYLNIMKATIDSLDIPQARIRAFDTRVNNIIRLIQEGRIDRAKLKASKFKAVLEKKLAKSDPKRPKPKKLSKTDAQLLLDMLNKLLDNLS